MNIGCWQVIKIWFKFQHPRALNRWSCWLSQDTSCGTWPVKWFLYKFRLSSSLRFDSSFGRAPGRTKSTEMYFWKHPTCTSTNNAGFHLCLGSDPLMKVLAPFFLKVQFTNSYFSSSFTSWPITPYNPITWPLDPRRSKSHLWSCCSKDPKALGWPTSPRLGEWYRISYCHSTATSPADGNGFNLAESYSGEIENYCKGFALDLGSKSFDLGLGFLIAFSLALFRIPPMSQNCCQARLLIVNGWFTKLENL